MNRTKNTSASSKTAAPAAPVRHQRHSSKRDDATILSLREELQTMYKSLQHKNDELIALERIILERDTTINGLAKERQRVMSGGGGANLSGKRNSGGGGDGGGGHSTASPKSFSSNIERDRMAKQSEIASERSDSSFSSQKTTSDAELIREKNETIKELNEKVLRLSRNLNLVHRNLQDRENRVAELQVEIDKFRQIVRPITQAMVAGKQQQRTCNCMEEWNNCISGIGDWSPGVESTRVLSVNEPRMKRQAISAEPLSQMADINELDGLVRIPKSSL